MIMEIKEANEVSFDKVAVHPLQSWSWGEFRKQTGVSVSRVGVYEKEKLVRSFQITWHKLPKTPYCIGYCPKSVLPNPEEMKYLSNLARDKGAIMIKFEPNRRKDDEAMEQINLLSQQFNFKKGKSLFTKFSFWLEIDRSEEEILKGMHQKTRYNLRLAEKKGVKIVEDENGFEDYWKLMEETTKRQGFYAHTKKYHQQMWQSMKKSGMGHLFKAVYEGKVLTTWILFVLNGVLYYPYGASSNQNREVMASNLLMWEAIKFGKKNHCKLFDMWGSLGPEPDVKDPWYGFHRFKQGYGPELVEFVGTYDLIVNPVVYKLYGMVDWLRWAGLKLLAKVR